MPSSHWNQIETIIEIARKINPKTILDIGCGFGKFGFLLREYLEVWNDRYLREEWELTIDAIEPTKEYIFNLQRMIYNDIYQMTLSEFYSKENNKQYDLILLIDVIEHFTKNDGIAILKQTLEHCDYLLIATPKKYYPQDNHDNHFEHHKSFWTRKDFKQIGKCQFFDNKRATIVLFGEKITLKKSTLKKKLGVIKIWLKKLLL